MLAYNACDLTYYAIEITGPAFLRSVLVKQKDNFIISPLRQPNFYCIEPLENKKTWSQLYNNIKDMNDFRRIARAITFDLKYFQILRLEDHYNSIKYSSLSLVDKENMRNKLTLLISHYLKINKFNDLKISQFNFQNPEVIQFHTKYKILKDKSVLIIKNKKKLIEIFDLIIDAQDNIDLWNEVFTNKDGILPANLQIRLWKVINDLICFLANLDKDKKKLLSDHVQKPLWKLATCYSTLIRTNNGLSIDVKMDLQKLQLVFTDYAITKPEQPKYDETEAITNTYTEENTDLNHLFEMGFNL